MSEDRLESILREHFQLETFRSGQREIIEAITSGRDTLAVMPTGGGKSLCYQLPAMALEGVTLVISPLISLMQDQVDGLRRRGLPSAMINSSVSAGDQRQCLEAVRNGEIKLLYVAPERFRQKTFLQTLGSIQLALIAIDEAHCLSQWGHDFRPDYLYMGKAIKALPTRPRLAAFTATATPEVRDDILVHLGLNEPAVFVSGFSRKNLSLKVLSTAGKTDKLRHLDKLIVENRVGIIYCATRKRVEEVAEHLAEWQTPHVAYHAGMSDDERQRAQELFMQGKVDVAVATNAFGMGIDRSDIRFVAHYEIPGSLEAYYQEVGRAGRDGKPSVCELYYNFADRRTQEFFIEGNNPEPSFIRELYGILHRMQDARHEILVSIADITEAMGGSRVGMAVSSAISQLRRFGIVERFDVPGQRTRGTRLLQPHLNADQIPLDEPAIRDKRLRDEAKLETVIRFATSRQCRQNFILNYFGDGAAEPCGVCDRCLSDPNTRKANRPLSESERLILRKALSGVARASRRTSDHEWQARFGRGKIIRMLVGSKAADLSESGLDQLSTFGLLAEHPTDFVQALFDCIESAGLIESNSDDKFPTLTLSERGSRVMLGEEPPPMNWPTTTPSSAKKAASEPESLPPEDHALFEALKQTRSILATAQRKPLYAIFPNATLVQLARHKPRSADAAIDLPGIGPYKAKTMLPPFLETIQRATNR